MIYIRKYEKTQRMTIEEKIDGSNFSIKLIDNKIYCYSRNLLLDREIKNNKFYFEAMDYVETFKDKLIVNNIYYFELIGQAKIKYEVKDIKDKLYLIDVFEK